MSEQSQSGNGESVASDPSVESHAPFEFESFDSPHPAASIASAAQRRANRRNARKSTGPRSAAGKARAKRNARTHGAFCRDALLPGEDPAALCELIVGAYGKFSPQDPIERGLVDRIVDAQWKIARLRRSERFAYGIGADRRADHDEADYLHKTWHQGRAPRHRAALQRVLNAALHDVPLQAPPPPPPPPPHPDDPANAADADRSRAAQDARERRHAQPPRGFADALDVAQAIADPAGVIERFSRITQRLEQSVSRAIRELRQLRADAREAADEEPLPCPYLEIDEEDEEEEEQDLDDRDEQDQQDQHDEHDEQDDDDEEDVEDQDAEEDDGAAGVVTSVTMSDPTTDIAQNEPNFAASLAGADEDERYDDTSCNIDLVALMRRAAADADAAERTGNRRREWKLA